MAGTVQGPLTDLERAKYTSDSTLIESTVRVRDDTTETARSVQTLSLLNDMLLELRKMNLYLQTMTDIEFQLSGKDGTHP